MNSWMRALMSPVQTQFMSKNREKYYRVNNFYLACFLFAKGFALANIDKTKDPKRAEFVFIDQIEREELVHQFNFGDENSQEMMIDARKLVYSIKTLKNKLYS